MFKKINPAFTLMILLISLFLGGFIFLIGYGITHPPSPTEVKKWEEDHQKALRDQLRRSIENGTESYVIKNKLWETNPKFDYRDMVDNDFYIGAIKIFHDDIADNPTSFDDCDDLDSDFYSGDKINKLNEDTYQTAVNAEVSISWTAGIYGREDPLIDDDLVVTFHIINNNTEIISVQ